MSLAPQTPFQWLRPIVVGDPTSGLIPAVGWKVKWYEAGTTTPSPIYTDPGLEIPYASPSNTAILNAYGRALIYLAPHGYKMVITNEFDVQQYEQDQINGGNSFGTGFAANFAALADVDPTLNQYCYIPGYLIAGDGGSGMFYAKTSGTPGDGGYVQRSNVDPTVAWFRIPDENGEVRAASFGYLPQNAGNQTSALIAADAYAASVNAPLMIQAGTAATVTNPSFTCSRVVFPQVGSRLSGTATVTFAGIVEAAQTTVLFFGLTATFSANQKNTQPGWFGATLTSSDNTAFLNAWIAAGGAYFELPAGTWKYADVGSFPWPGVTPVNLLGILNGNDTNYGPGLWYAGQIRASIFRFDNDKIIFSNGEDLEMDAGLGVGGAITAIPGTGNQTFAVGGTIYKKVTTAQNTGTGVTTLGSYAFPNNSIISVGDEILLECSGTVAANANVKVINAECVPFLTAIAEVTQTPNTGGRWRISARVIVTSMTTLLANGESRIFDASTLRLLINTDTTNTISASGTLIGTALSPIPNPTIVANGASTVTATLTPARVNNGHFGSKTLSTVSSILDTIFSFSVIAQGGATGDIIMDYMKVSFDPAPIQIS